jgi:hypothetical protein
MIMQIDINLLIKILPLLSILIAGLAVYFTYKNRASKHREIIYDKQFFLSVKINQKIVELENEIYILTQNNNKSKIEESQIKYAELLNEIACILNFEGRIILQDETISCLYNLINYYYTILPEILSVSDNLNLPEKIKDRHTIIVKWQNLVRKNFGIDSLSKQNSSIIK